MAHRMTMPVVGDLGSAYYAVLLSVRKGENRFVTYYKSKTTDESKACIMKLDSDLADFIQANGRTSLLLLPFFNHKSEIERKKAFRYALTRNKDIARQNVVHVDKLLELLRSGLERRDMLRELSNSLIMQHLFSKDMVDKLNADRRAERGKGFRYVDGWSNEIVEEVRPEPFKHLIYVAYFPESDIIKYGMTQNWLSRKQSYERQAGQTEETNGRMLIGYVFYIQDLGSQALNDYLLMCAEDRVARLVQELGLMVVEGKEFITGITPTDFAEIVEQTLSNMSVREMLSERSDTQMRRYCRRLDNGKEVLLQLTALKSEQIFL